jgi:hypothetical protein
LRKAETGFRTVRALPICVRARDHSEQRTKAILSNIYDPNGVRMELLQLPPDSPHAQATSRWE